MLIRRLATFGLMCAYVKSRFIVIVNNCVHLRAVHDMYIPVCTCLYVISKLSIVILVISHGSDWQVSRKDEEGNATSILARGSTADSLANQSSGKLESRMQRLLFAGSGSGNDDFTPSSQESEEFLVNPSAGPTATPTEAPTGLMPVMEAIPERSETESQKLLDSESPETAVNSAFITTGNPDSELPNGDSAGDTMKADAIGSAEDPQSATGDSNVTGETFNINGLGNLLGWIFVKDFPIENVFQATFFFRSLDIIIK